jgi:hypothetical protein
METLKTGFWYRPRRFRVKSDRRWLLQVWGFEKVATDKVPRHNIKKDFLKSERHVIDKINFYTRNAIWGFEKVAQGLHRHTSATNFASLRKSSGL